MDPFRYSDSEYAFPFGIVNPYHDSANEYVESLDTDVQEAVKNHRDELHTRAEIEEFVKYYNDSVMNRFKR
jgi:hypothetical protein